MVSDGIMRELYVRQCSKIMKVSEQTVLTALQERLTKNAIAQRDRDVARQRQQEAQQRAAFEAQLNVHSKYTVIETEENMLNDLVERALNELRHLMEMCDDIMHTIERQEKEGAPEEEILKNLQTFAQLNKIKTQFAAEMGERAVIR